MHKCDRQQAPEGFFPDCFRLMADKPYTIKMEISEANVVNKSGLYWGTNICQGFKLESTEPEKEQTIPTANEQATSSTQMPTLSGLNCSSSAITNQSASGKETFELCFVVFNLTFVIFFIISRNVCNL